jgi:DNA-binding phage protein
MKTRTVKTRAESQEGNRLRLSIARGLDALCSRHGYGYHKLAREARVSPSTLFPLLKGSGNPQLSTLVALAHALGYDLRVAFLRREGVRGGERARGDPNLASEARVLQ